MITESQRGAISAREIVAWSEKQPLWRRDLSATARLGGRSQRRRQRGSTRAPRGRKL